MAREFAKSFYRSKEWQMTRDYVLKRDAYLCRHCGAPAEEVHHIIHLSEENIGDISVTMNPINLVSLCKDCHFKDHKRDRANGHRKNQDILEDVFFDEEGNVCMNPPVKN